MSNTLGIAREKAGLDGRESESKGSGHAKWAKAEMGSFAREQDVYKCTRLRDDRRVVPGRYSKLLYIE